jgi:YidC/Oxa1 family membrane protein insertase
MFSFLNDPLKAILLGIYSVVGNYGWSIVVFTLLIRVVLMPLDAKSRKSMRKTQKMQPQIAALQKKYKNDKDKLNQKTMEIYRKEKISPLSGCLPMLFSLPILFGMFGAMNVLAHEQIAGHVFTYLSGSEPQYQGWLWVHNIWMPDSPFFPRVPDENSIKQVMPENWQAAYAKLSDSEKAAIDTYNQTLPEDQKINFDFSSANYKTTVEKIVNVLKTSPDLQYKEKLETVPGLTNISLMITTLSVFTLFNGFFILPLLAAVSQFIMSFALPQTPTQDGKPGTANFMKWFFPIFSLFICFSYNAGFSLYWVTANLIAAAQNVLLNKYFDAQEKKAAAMGEGTVK